MSRIAMEQKSIMNSPYILTKGENKVKKIDMLESAILYHAGQYEVLEELEQFLGAEELEKIYKNFYEDSKDFIIRQGLCYDEEDEPDEWLRTKKLETFLIEVMGESELLDWTIDSLGNKKEKFLTNLQEKWNISDAEVYKDEN